MINNRIHNQKKKIKSTSEMREQESVPKANERKFISMISELTESF